MNDRWRRRFYLENKKKITSEENKEYVFYKKFYDYWDNPPTKSFMK